MSDAELIAQMSEPMCVMRTKDVKQLADRIDELEAKLAQQDDLVQAAAGRGRGPNKHSPLLYRARK